MLWPMGYRDDLDSDVRRLLNDLCVRLGFCLPPDGIRRLELSPPHGIDAFTDAVLTTEGMGDMSHTQTRAQVREVVAMHMARWPHHAPEHAVIVSFALSGGPFGSEEERAAVRVLQARLSGAIDLAGVGEIDGNEFGAGQCTIYAYGPDATRLFSAMESHLRASPFRPAAAILRFGEAADPDAVEQRIDL